jgi:hypothetical protein
MALVAFKSYFAGLVGIDLGVDVTSSVRSVDFVPGNFNYYFTANVLRPQLVQADTQFQLSCTNTRLQRLVTESLASSVVPDLPLSQLWAMLTTAKLR